MADVDFEQQIKAAIGGDPDALSTLLEGITLELRQRLAGEIAPKWQSMLEVDDVLQVTFAEVFQQIDRYQPDGPKAFRNWLLQIARNNIRDGVKWLGREKRPQPDKRVRAIKTSETTRTLLGMLAGDGATPSMRFSDHELATLLKEALDRLPVAYAEVVRLYDLEGLDGPEVGRRIGRSRGAVFMLRARAHERLRDLLGDTHRFFDEKP